ncbi:MAG: hypothetical protein KGQ66_12850, partial [Acidobacteriota bacterium]|nr:hypothetical protein [Acidobacteriota bacterium]
MTASAALASYTLNGPRPQVGGVNLVWSGGGGDGLWSDANNWVGGVSPSSGDSVLFPGPGGATVTDDINLGAGSLAGVVFQGGTWVVDGSAADPLAIGVSLTASSGAQVTVNAPVTGTASISLDADSTSSLTVAGGLTGSTVVIDDGGNTGPVKLSGSDSQTETQVDGGSDTGGGLVAASPSAVGSAVAVNSAGWLYLDGGGSSLTVTAPLTLAQAGATVVDRSNDTWAGPVTLSASGRVAAVSNDTFDVQGVVRGAGSLTVNGAGNGSTTNDFYGTVYLPGANQYSGGTFLPTGYLVAANATALGTATVQSGPGVTGGGQASLEVDCSCTITNSLVLAGPGMGNFPGTLSAGPHAVTAVVAGPVQLSAGLSSPPNLVAVLGATLDLTGQVTYSGGSGLSSPLIQAYGSVAVSGANAATLTGGIQVDGTVPQTANGTLTASGNSGALGSGTVQLSIDGALDLQGVSPTAPIDAVGPLVLGTCQGTAGESLYDLSGGDTYAGPITVEPCAALDISDGGAQPFAVTQPISGAGAINISGVAGPTYLDGANTYTGPTTVQTGTLGGTGSVSATTVDSGATLAPGVPTGTLTVNGSLTMATGSTLAVTLDSTTSGGYSQLAVDGAGPVSLGGAVLNISSAPGFTGVYGAQVDLVVNHTGSPVVGGFAGLAQGAVVTLGGQQWLVSYRGGSSGHDVVLVDTSGAPVAPAAPAGATGSASAVSPAVGGPLTVSLPPLSAEAVGGLGALTVAVYGSDPVAASPGSGSPVYFDVASTPGSTFTSVQVTTCAVPGAVISWWDPTRSSWQLVTPAPVVSGACETFTLSAASLPDLAQLNGTIFAAVPRPGYRLVGSDGGLFSFGDAGFFGSTGGVHLAAPIVGAAASPDGRGYWLVGSDGGVFSFGDAGFFGSTGGVHLAAPIVGMAASPDGRGYWLVGSDGGVFSFGDAGFFGSTGGVHLAAPIVG